MLVKTITYTDYDGNERTEDFHFNLTQSEIMEMELSTEGGLEKTIKKIVDTQNGAKIMELFKSIIVKAYGEKSDDGRRFIKNKEIQDAFVQTEAYNQLFMELATDSDAATKFINGVVPKMAAETPATIAAKNNK